MLGGADGRAFFRCPGAIVRVLDAVGFYLEVEEVRFVPKYAVQDGEPEVVIEDRPAALLRRRTETKVSTQYAACDGMIDS